MSTIVETVLKIHPSNTIIHDECEKKYFWQMLLEFWKLPKSFKHFPGPNPVSMERTNFTRIREEDFMISLKTDGIRYLLILTTKPNSIEPIALMIDRAFNMHEVEIWANEEFFYNGCLFDGELVRNCVGLYTYSLPFLSGILIPYAHIWILVAKLLLWVIIG